LHATLDCAKAALHGAAGGLRPARCELLHLALELAIFFDELGDHRVELFYQLITTKPARCRLAAWWTAATPLLPLRGFVCCHLGS